MTALDGLTTAVEAVGGTIDVAQKHIVAGDMTIDWTSGVPGTDGRYDVAITWGLGSNSPVTQDGHMSDSILARTLLSLAWDGLFPIS